jgi:hypothetical protein
MPHDLSVAARLMAYQRGRAIRISSHIQIAIRPDAMVLCPIAMAGEDATVHILAVGRIGKQPEILCVPDPRFRDDQYILLEQLGAKVESYIAECRAANTYPQLWVSSGAAVSHLDILADHLRYVASQRVKRLGELLTYFAHRFPVKGQQALQAATVALRTHFVTGQQPSEDEHLGALLAWIDPPKGRNVLVSVTQAEQEPMGVHTDPLFDRDVLVPLVEAYNTARRNGASASALSYRANGIRDALMPMVLRIFKATQESIAILCRLGLPPLPGLSDAEQHETKEFAYFMAGRDAGFNIPLQDRPKAAAFQLVARLNAEQNLEAAVMLGDEVGRASGRLNGRILVGEVADPTSVRVAPRRFEMRFAVWTSQHGLRVRRGDNLFWQNDPRLEVLVVDVRRQGATTRVLMQILRGSRAVGLPSAGTIMTFVSDLPDWERIIRDRNQLQKRLSIAPWTHDHRSVPPAPRRKTGRPQDPLRAIRGLQ